LRSVLTEGQEVGRERREPGVAVHGAELMTGESAFQFGLGDVLAREPLRNAFFGCHLYLVIMREADIPHISVSILLLESSRS
ncbi:hypothetical protein KUCAC02_004243, partial [Chaenocephalus aceratus]